MREAQTDRRTETLDYLQSMLGQLRKMAETERCDVVAYLIAMAHVEVGAILRGERPARVRQDGRSGAGWGESGRLAERVFDPTNIDALMSGAGQAGDLPGFRQASESEKAIKSGDGAPHPRTEKSF